MILLNKTPDELKKILDTKQFKIRMRAMGLLMWLQEKEKISKSCYSLYMYDKDELKRECKKQRRVYRNIERLKKFLG